MSFATDAKLEILKSKIENDCCSIAFLSAIIKCSGELSISNNHQIKVEIYTELRELFDIILEEDFLASLKCLLVQCRHNKLHQFVFQSVSQVYTTKTGNKSIHFRYP